MTVHADRSQPHRGWGGGAQPFIWQLFQNMCEILKKLGLKGWGVHPCLMAHAHCMGPGQGQQTIVLYCIVPLPVPVPVPVYEL